MTAAFDRSHGSPWDRGDSDRYYGRRWNPHRRAFTATGASVGALDVPLTDPAEIAAYSAGFDAGDSGAKDWGSPSRAAPHPSRDLAFLVAGTPPESGRAA